MANIRSAKKRARQSIVRTERNRERISRVRTFIRKVEEAITSGNKVQAVEALKVAQPEIVRGAVKGALHHKTASRKISRLALRINAIAS